MTYIPSSVYILESLANIAYLLLSYYLYIMKDEVQVSEQMITITEPEHESCECNLETSTNNSLGMTLIFFATMCFCIGNAFVNIVGVQIPVLQIVFIRGCSQLFIALIVIAATKRSRCSSLSTWIGTSKNRLKLLSRAVLGVAATGLEFAALQVCLFGLQLSSLHH